MYVFYGDGLFNVKKNREAKCIFLQDLIFLIKEDYCLYVKEIVPLIFFLLFIFLE